MAFWNADWQVLLALGVIIALALWFANRQRYAFVLVIKEGGNIRIRQGKVAGPFLEQVRTVCQEHSLQSGWIGGVRQGRNIRLVFSAAVPPGCRQQMRNIWAQVG
jgi:hypothetical protein